MPRRVDSIQEGRTPDVPPAERDRLYWHEMERLMLGTVRFRNGTITALGFVPLIRLGPLEGDHRRIVGGLLAAEAGGTLGWEHEGGVTRVALRGFAPRLPPLLYVVQDTIHKTLSALYLRRLRSASR